jgi:RNA polymerase sigma-70 factor, ECF subfamily
MPWSLARLGERDRPAGDEARPYDFRELYAQHFAFVWRCLRASGVQDSSLDDAAQDVFVAVHRNLAGFRGDSSVRTWLYGVVRNVAQNQRRSVRRRGVQGELDEHLRASDPDPLEVAEGRDAAEFVQRFAAQLTESKRDVFVLALVEQLTIPEVAEILQIPLNTAYSRLRIVRQELQQALEAVGAP